jgi:2-polyprenyl-3-methyl-5-hydroxy-6-metoxy-1,4-benzoquinol methylase
MDLAFVIGQLPPRPVRVLEVGCGQGELAQGLDAAGYDVLAIDPVAPEGPIFRRVTLEELDDAEPFAAVVACRSLHHVDDLSAAIGRIATLLEPRGLLILDEFGWDLLDRRTAEWYGHGKPVEEVLARWDGEHDGLHGYGQMRRELDRRFEERFLSWEPYLYRLLAEPAAEAEERELIERGGIRAIGFRYMGTRR